MERGTAMSKYLVKLMPLGKFFFGGDMTFKVDNEETIREVNSSILKGGNMAFKVDDKETAFSSYIIHSFMTPQQTSILGMMRFLILSNNADAFNCKGNCITDKGKADALIGEQGFVVGSSKHNPSDYQSIKNVGPCFIWETQKHKSFFRGAKDVDLQIGKKKDMVDATINMMSVQLPKIDIQKDGEMKPFTGKDYLPGCYISLDGEKLKESDIFIEDTRIGINKSYTGKSENNAFYKQVSYRLEKNFCFAFEVEVSDSIDLTAYNKQVVKLGADDSSFVFEAERVVKVDYPVSKEGLRVVLLSDTYLPDIAICNVLFAITDVRPFRFLSISNSTNAQDYNVKYKSSRSAKRYDLYQAGSVFYFKDEKDKKDFCKRIDSYQEFKQIGYNQYC